MTVSAAEPLTECELVAHEPVTVADEDRLDLVGRRDLGRRVEPAGLGERALRRQSRTRRGVRSVADSTPTCRGARFDVFGHVAPDGARDLGRGVGGVVEAEGFGCLRDGQVAHTGLHPGRTGLS